MRNLILGLGFVAAALMLMVATSIAGERVVLLDECDPATFNAALVADTCINAVGAPILGAPVTFTDFLAALPTGHPAWLFQPGKLIIRPGRNVRATNEGGEVHTFTEVAKFGGGFITALNNPSVKSSSGVRGRIPQSTPQAKIIPDHATRAGRHTCAYAANRGGPAVADMALAYDYPESTCAGSTAR
jgi:hypothetical protein